MALAGLGSNPEFVDNSLLFPTLKDFSKWLTVDEVIAKCSTPCFFEAVYVSSRLQ